ncbi:MAG: hypothetical protein HFJ41_05460 [Clostridia bacterium]|nr:hypothetical protein [Clostridia bacterium]
MKYINSKKIDNIKLTKENFYILIDFDRTLTKGNSISGWRVLYHSGLLGDDFTKRYDEIHDQNHETWEYRFKAYINLLREKGLNNEIIKDAVKDIKLELRDGAKEFLLQMYNLNIPVIIISCSLKNVIKEYLKFNNCYYNNIYIYSNYYDIEDNGKNDIYEVTPHSKNKITFSKELNEIIKTRDYALLFGDIVDDVNMVSKDKLNSTITVGFLDKKIEENLELYKSTFDIVLTDNANFKEIEDIIKLEKY